MAALELPTTSPTLLRLLALPESDEAWRVFVGRYGPLVSDRCRRAGLQRADADDIRAAVFAALLESIPEFRYDPARRFRGYLQRAIDNAIRTHWRTLRRRPGWVGRGGPASDGLPEPLADLAGELDDQIRARVEDAQRAVDRVRFEVGPDAWAAFTLTAIEERSGIEAAEQLGRSVAAVYMAKSRVLRLLRAEAGLSPNG